LPHAAALDAQSVALVALVDKLQAQNLELAGRVGYYQAEVEQLRTALKVLEAGPDYGPGEEPRPLEGEPTASAHGELL